MRDALYEVFEQARNDTARFLLTLLGIVLASGAAVFLASVLYGAGVGLSQASQRATGDDVVRIRPRDVSSAERMAHGRAGLRRKDATALARHERLDEARVQASRKAGPKVVRVRKRHLRVTFQSGGRKAAALVGLELLHGRWPTEAEDGQRLCVVGYAVWNKLLGAKWPLRGTDRFLVLDHATELKVVGVLRSRPMLGSTTDPSWTLDYRVWVSDDTFRESIAPKAEIAEIVMRTAPAQDGTLPDKTLAALRLYPYLESLHRGLRDFRFDALRKSGGLDKMIVGALSIILVGCSLIAMLVGSINVMNAQLVTLNEKTREYAIRRAVGLSARRLRWLVLLETVTMTVMGSVVGVAAGLGLAWALAQLLSGSVMPWPFRVIWWSVGATAAAALLAGLLAGWVPSQRAAKISVAESLRDV